MARVLHCRDAGFDCDAVVEAESDEAVLAQVGPHVAEVHGQQLDQDMADSLRPLIRSA